MSAPTRKLYPRFTLSQRIEHIFMLSSFTLLALTGLPQKFATSGVAAPIVNAFGGIEAIRMVHRWSAIVMIVVSLYHLVAVAYGLWVTRAPQQKMMLPGLQDAKDALQAFLYNIGLAKAYPRMGRFTFEEKAEYWAFVWGTVVMVATGFMMWNPIATASFLPGEVIPAAKYAHGGEAVLAVLAIIVWHMYGVHLKKLNPSMFTGSLDEESMRHEHPLELEERERGATPPADPAGTARRRQVFLPIATVLSLVLLAGLYVFVTFEKTAIETVPRRDDATPVYVPQTPTPRPTALPTPTRQPQAPQSFGGPTLTRTGRALTSVPACGASHERSRVTLNSNADTTLTTVASSLAPSFGPYTSSTWKRSVHHV